MSVPARLEPDRTGTFDGVGGIEIWWQAWLAEGTARADVVLAHGAGEHSSRYGHVAKALRERGYSTWALDHRGHGHSRGDRALIDRLHHATTDMHSFIDQVSAETNQEPFLLGHSMGGLLSLAYTLCHEQTIRALALSAPLASLGAASTFDRAASTILTRIAPKLGVLQVDASGISRDPEVVRDYETDPLVFHGKLPVRTVHELAKEIAGLEAAVPSIRMPVLVMYGTADPIVPPAGSIMVGDRLGSDDLTVTPYEGLFHEILNEPERDQVIAEICSWLDAHC